jgi:hypothetical protein
MMFFCFVFIITPLLHYSIIPKNPEITGPPASPELAMAGRHHKSSLGINQSHFLWT